jgi:hypothetical protein
LAAVKLNVPVLAGIVTGGVPVKIVDEVLPGNFDVVDGGAYYIDRVARRPNRVLLARRFGSRGAHARGEFPLT